MKITILIAFLAIAFYCTGFATMVGTTIALWLAPLSNVFHV